MIIQRTLNLSNLLKKKSFFLFGPRATGKSFIVEQQLGKNALVLNLLHGSLSLRLMSQPSDLERLIMARPECDLVVLDEVQKIPQLLDEVHRLIESKGIRFLLTGSSARQLRRGAANLLAGRAWQANLFPLTSHEINQFDLTRYLQYGGLPPVYLSEEPQEELYAYVDTYLKEEIQAESIVRKLPAFTRFLPCAALASGHIINFSSIASDTGISMSTVREYYQILEDTFMGYLVPGWTKSQKRKAASTAKFYWFDLGVRNTLIGLDSISPHTDQYGLLFEHFIACELRAYLSYKRLRYPISYWQTRSHQEVDFIIGDEIAIEVKSTTKVMNKHLKSLRLIAEEKLCQKYILVSQDPFPQRVDNIDIIPWNNFLKQLWGDALLL